MDNTKINNLKKEYELKKSAIKRRLAEFKKFYHHQHYWSYAGNQMQLREHNVEDNQRIFEEICFCILTANTTAEMGMRSIDKIRHLLTNGTAEQLSSTLNGTYRFPNLRAKFIVETRENLKNKFNFEIKKTIESIKDREQLRDFLVENIKGFGYKESSHFLRNIGYEGYGILDKHILSNMVEFGIVNELKKPNNKKKYVELETKLKEFSKNIEIPIDELDLLFWSRKNGRILK